MLCKICNINEAKEGYGGFCPNCRSKKYDFSKNKKCADCGKSISNKSTYCENCNSVRKRKRVIRVCEYCKKEYETKESARKRFCSKKCMNLSDCKSLSSKGVNIKHTETIEASGYVTVHVEGRHRRVRIHTLKAEAVLGRRLKPGECVHHIDLNKANNENSNLLICTLEYHRWLHARLEHFWVDNYIKAKKLIGLQP